MFDEFEPLPFPEGAWGREMTPTTGKGVGPPMSVTRGTKAGHEHVWEPVGVVEDEQILYSPVSAMDHVLVTRKLAIRSCPCGAIRRTEVSRKSRWLNR